MSYTKATLLEPEDTGYPTITVPAMFSSTPYTNGFENGYRCGYADCNTPTDNIEAPQRTPYVMMFHQVPPDYWAGFMAGYKVSFEHAKTIMTLDD